MFQLDESGHIEVFYDGEDINDIEAEIRSNPIIADPIFSAQSLYFRELCKFDSYANALIEDKQLEIVSTNIDLLQHFYSNKGRSKKFRLIKHTGTGKYFFRALVSTDGYRDYNINVSVVIALVSIYRAMITSQSNYRINLFYLNHSSISVFFENTLTKPISGVGRIKTELILTNDETAQGTVTVTGLFSILVDIKEQTVDLKIKKPENSTRPKEKVLSISHGQRPETAIKQMDVHQGLIDTEKRMIKEAEEISKIKNVEPLINLFKDRLKAKEKTYKDATKAELARVFKDQVTTFKELLEVMSKTQLIFDSEGVEVREFLKYLAYTILVKKGGDSN